MDFSYFKYMFYINKHKNINWTDLCIDFKVSKPEAREIVKYLRDTGYISNVSDTRYISTIKGQKFFTTFISQWLLNNLLAIIAIVISIIALFK